MTNTIRLIKEDFDEINISFTKGNNRQYIDFCNCPIAKAAKRKFNNDDLTVGPDRIYLPDKILYIEGRPHNVEKCRKSLLKGSKYSIIKIVGSFFKS